VHLRAGVRFSVSAALKNQETPAARPDNATELNGMILGYAATIARSTIVADHEGDSGGGVARHTHPFVG